MDIQEISAKGLSREIKITVSKDDLSSRLDNRLSELKQTVQLRGFRKGKVPTAHLKNVYGTQVMSEIVQEAVKTESQKALTSREERPALQPEIKLDGEVEPIMNGEADLVFAMSYDVIPPIALTDFAKIKLERCVADVSDAEVKQAMEQLAASHKQFTPREKTAKAQMGDSVKMDFLGKIDGTAFDGGSGQGFELELGSGQFIPGFEDKLVGVKAGDTLDVEVPFPADYNNADLAGKLAVFTCTIHTVSAPQAAKLDDAFAVSMGLDNLAKLEEAVREQISRDYQQFTREQVKKELLDVLEEKHDFDLPDKMIELEFNQIWQQFEQELASQNRSIDTLDENEKDLRAEYRAIAERRVRTGLVLAEIGNKQNIEVSQEEINQALMQRAQQFPGQEKQVFDYFRSNPEAMAQIRAPIFEDKVVDFIIEKVDIKDKKVSVEELKAQAEEDKKPAKKTAAKKAAPKKTAAKKPAAKKPTAKKPAAKNAAPKKTASKTAKKPAKKPATKKK